MKNILTIILLITFIATYAQVKPKYSIPFDLNPMITTKIEFSPDAKYIAYGTADGEVVIFNLLTGKEEFKLSGHEKRVVAVAFHPKGNQLASGDKKGIVKIWDLKTKTEKRSYPAHDKPILCMAYSPDGSTLFSGGRDNYIKIRDVETGKHLQTIGKTKGNIRALRFSPDGKYVICATSSLSNSVQYYELESGKNAKIINSVNTQYIDISPDERLFASANLDPNVIVWDVKTGKKLYDLKGHKEFVKGVCFSPGGKILASCSDDKTIKLWDLKKKGCLYTFTDHKENVEFVNYSPDGKWLVSLGWDDVINIYNLENLNLPKEDIYIKPDNTDLPKEEQDVITESFNNLEFDLNKSTIKESSKPSLNKLSDLLKKKTAYKLKISGHTDNTGDANSNYKLSIDRAMAVKNYLVSKGVDANIITSNGYGATKPIADNRTEEGRQKNRRVEFEITQ
ncbi:MAG: hypothetical protein C0594_03335 [Marinilabiliales bacterium]|nr:MAG: hypothetical protein C0594_03335 [Marinilabiliales bacterium]